MQPNIIQFTRGIVTFDPGEIGNQAENYTIPQGIATFDVGEIGNAAKHLYNSFKESQHSMSATSALKSKIVELT